MIRTLRLDSIPITFNYKELIIFFLLTSGDVTISYTLANTPPILSNTTHTPPLSENFLIRISFSYTVHTPPRSITLSYVPSTYTVHTQPLSIPPILFYTKHSSYLFPTFYITNKLYIMTIFFTFFHYDTTPPTLFLPPLNWLLHVFDIYFATWPHLPPLVHFYPAVGTHDNKSARQH